MKVTGGLRYKFCPDCGEMHDVHDWPDNHRRPFEALAAPSVICDEMAPTQNMVDGKYYTSKAKMRATYLPSGNEKGTRYAELGNDPSILKPKPFKKPKPDRQKIKAAVHSAFSKAGFGA